MFSYVPMGRVSSMSPPSFDTNPRRASRWDAAKRLRLINVHRRHMAAVYIRRVMGAARGSETGAIYDAVGVPFPGGGMGIRTWISSPSSRTS